MKKILMISSIAFAMGLGVAAGAHQPSRAVEVRADNVTVYCKMTASWWTYENAAIGVHYWGGTSPATTWPGNRGTYVTTDTGVWKFSVPNDVTGLMFSRMNPSDSGGQDWGAKTKELTLQTDGKNLFTINSTEVWGDPGCEGTWSEYTEPAPDVPAEDGYYIVGTKSNWKFAGATKMDAGQGTDQAQLLQYHATAGESFKARSYLNGVDTWYGVPDVGNYDVGESDKIVNIYVNQYNQLYVADYVEPDVPDSDGYYLVGSKTNFKFKNAPSLTEIGHVDGEAAYKLDYSANENEKIKVRGYFHSDENPDKWSFYDGTTVSFGAADGDGNFVFNKDQHVDIFAKWVEVSENNWQLQFKVEEQATRYIVTIHDVLFEGKVKASVLESTHLARATAGVNFSYELPAMNGYYARKLYEDENCITEYTPKALTANTNLYAKYTRLGYYVTGDATYSGSAALAWNVDGATYLSTQVNDPNNMLEGAVTIPNSASKENPVRVKALEYIGDQEYDDHGVIKHTQWAGITYELGEEYSFASLDEDSNIVMTKGGTFSVYVNKDVPPKVYLSEGKQAFLTKFISEIGNVCHDDGSTVFANLVSKWNECKAVYNSLNPTEKSEIEAVTEGDPKGNDTQKVVAKYKYILNKYGTSEEGLTDFIWGQDYQPQTSPYISIMNNTNTAIILVVAIATTIAVAGVSLFVIKRKKRIEE